MLSRVLVVICLAVVSVGLCSCASSHKSMGVDAEGWASVVADDLSNCTFNEGSWTVEDGVLTRHGKGDIWTKKAYGDFVLDVEFKVAEGTNSGIFIRTADIVNWLHSGIEIQVHDSHGSGTGKHVCGAVYDVQEPSVVAVKPAGEWNQISITAKGPLINIVLNGQEIIDIDLNDWPTAHLNKDETKNKFNIAYKDMVREGVFGFQDHGKPVWYRNIRVKEL